jgi:hypothetical protein
MLMLPGEFSTSGEYDRSYWLPTYARIDDMVEQYFGLGSTRSALASNPSSLRVAIQDSTGDELAVQSLIERLYDSGYRNVFVDRTPKESLAETRIVAQQGDRASAETIQQSVGIGEVRVESTGNLDSDITIQVGEDWVAEHGAAL